MVVVVEEALCFLLQIPGGYLKRKSGKSDAEETKWAIRWLEITGPDAERPEYMCRDPPSGVRFEWEHALLLLSKADSATGQTSKAASRRRQRRRPARVVVESSNLERVCSRRSRIVAPPTKKITPRLSVFKTDLKRKRLNAVSLRKISGVQIDADDNQILNVDVGESINNTLPRLSKKRLPTTTTPFPPTREERKKRRPPAREFENAGTYTLLARNADDAAKWVSALQESVHIAKHGAPPGNCVQS